jgi:predicted nucleotidyltransferase
MDRKLPIDIPYDRMIEFCKKWQITEFALFGSVLRDDFRSDSDIDVLVKFSEEAHSTLFDMVDMQEELEQLLGRKVDLVSRRAIESSRNYIRRKAILSSLEILYAAA